MHTDIDKTIRKICNPDICEGDWATGRPHFAWKYNPKPMCHFWGMPMDKQTNKWTLPEGGERGCNKDFLQQKLWQFILRSGTILPKDMYHTRYKYIKQKPIMSTFYTSCHKCIHLSNNNCWKCNWICLSVGVSTMCDFQGGRRQLLSNFTYFSFLT